MKRLITISLFLLFVPAYVFTQTLDAKLAEIDADAVSLYVYSIMLYVYD